MANHRMPGDFLFPPYCQQLPLPPAVAPPQQGQGDYATPSSHNAQMAPYPGATAAITAGFLDASTPSGMPATPPPAGSGDVSAGTGEREPSAAVPRQENGPSVTSFASGSGGGGSSSNNINNNNSGGVGAGHSSNPHAPKPIRRRMRLIMSCLECRRRKLGCDKGQPCRNCVKHSRECVFLSPKLDEVSQQRLNEIKERVGSLEKQLETNVAKARASPDGDGFCQQRIVADDVEDGLGEERDMQITPVVALDLTYEDDADGIGTGNLIDLGIRVGRMRITERIGGLSRPRMWEEIQAGISGAQTRCGYEASAELPDSTPIGELPEFLRPGESYIPPSSGFFFGQTTESPALLQLLPTPGMGERLIHRYFEAVHPIARCVHRPSFEATYQSFWDDVSGDMEPRAPTQAVVFAAWLSAAVSLDEIRAQREYGCSKNQLVFNMRIGTETALSKAKFLSTTSVDTLQAFVMYMLPLCRDEVSRAHSVLVGAAIRMAECMGLHQDGSAYGLSPLETHVRRLIWHQLCFLDIRTCEAQGPKPAIRRGEYTTKLPLNCDEEELTPHTTVAPAMAERWTPALLSIIRFEINAMMRTIWADRNKPEAHKPSLNAMLAKVEQFRKRMFDKYNRFLDEGDPIQKYTKLVMQLLMYRLHAMVLHPYHTNATTPLPDKLHGLLVTSGIFIIEIAIQLESTPLFRDWAWYLGAYQQYHIALLLATEIYYRPDHKDAERIWPCLDYVFRMDPNMPRDQKSLQILTEIKDKTAVYMSMRRVRAPTAISEVVLGSQAAVVKEPTPPRPLHPPPAPPLTRAHPPFPQAGAGTIPGPGGYLKTEAAAAAAANTVAAVPASSMPERQPHPHPRSHPHPHAHLHQQPHLLWAHQYMGTPPPPPMVYGGVSNGEVLWSLPPHQHASPNSSDGESGSVVGGCQQQGQQRQQRQDSGSESATMPGGQGPGPGPARPLGAMENIDWEEINQLFPPDPHTGELSFMTFVDPAAAGMGAAAPWPGQ